MKKALSLLLIIALCLSLTGCFKSEEAKEVEELIDKIGTVTLDNTKALEKAEKAYNKLTEEQKEEVENYDVLKAARAKVEELTNKSAAAEVDAVIEAIGTVTLDSGSAIAAAREAYDAAPPEVQKYVGKLDVLESATAELERLKHEKLQGEANVVIELINQIGTVGLESGGAISAANEAYEALSADAKALVSNADVLTSASANYKALCKERADALLSAMRVDDDPVRGMKFYYPDAFPYYDYLGYWGADVRCFVLPYIGMQGDDVWLRLVCDYTADDWVFFTKITFAVDSQRFYKTFSYFDVTRDNEYGDVWEFVDIDVNASEIELLRAIANSTNTIVRFEGDDYYEDFTVSQADKEAIKQVLIIYDAYQ